ncbi:MAG TPA: hypothetical protein VHW01_01620 [Polyangiaceae bacterium]|nr:hypothetical protein [Polyangiaceae bacterium]
MDALSPGTASKVNAASYADTAEGGKEASPSANGKSGSSQSGAASASGSAHAGSAK